MNIRMAIIGLVFSILTGTQISCSKIDPVVVQKDMKELVVPESFDWSTVNQVKFVITSPISGIIRIESEDHAILYYKGFYNGADEKYIISAGLPANLTAVLINGQRVNVSGKVINVTLVAAPLLKGGQITGPPVSYWNFDENGGDVLHDHQSTHHGQITGAGWVPGLIGSALRFVGVLSNVSIPASPALQLTSAVTLMAWVKTENYASVKISQKGDWDGYGIYLDLWKGWKASIYLDDHTSHDVGTTDGRPVLNQWYHIAMTYDGAYLKLYVNGIEKGSNYVPGKLFKTTRPFSIGSDNAQQKFFKGAIDEVYLYGEALTPQQISSYYSKAPNQDRDGDGIPDADDDFPDDKDRSFSIFYPALSSGSLAFEDLWPGKGDYDFNDLVLDYRFNTITNASNLVKEIKLDVTIRAIGASLPSGFGFQFGGEKLKNSDLRVSGYSVQSDRYNLAENGIEVGQRKPTIIVFDKASRLLKWQGGTGVNTDPAFPVVQPVTLSVFIEFVAGSYTQEDIGIIDFNPFIIVNEDRGREIHLPNHPPTTLASSDFFGTSQDKTDLVAGHYYKTDRNLPWALNLIQTFEYPIEKTQITAAYLRFYDWAASGGQLFPDWNQAISGYRSLGLIYKK